MLEQGPRDRLAVAPLDAAAQGRVQGVAVSRERPPHPHNPNEKPHPETQTTPTCATQDGSIYGPFAAITAGSSRR